METPLTMKTLTTALLAAAVTVGFAGSAYAENHQAPMKGATVIVKGHDVVDTAMKSADHKTLVAALKAADLVATLEGKGPFTVFAPTDAAFAKLPKGTLAMLLKPENKAKLVNILTYHVVPAKVTAAAAIGMSKHGVVAHPKTLQGQVLNVKSNGLKVMINGAAVTKADIVCTNGIIHVIDSVLLPKK